jgi:hypothetical protein
MFSELHVMNGTRKKSKRVLSGAGWQYSTVDSPMSLSDFEGLEAIVR